MKEKNLELKKITNCQSKILQSILQVGSQVALKHTVLKLKPFLYPSHEGQPLP